MITGVGDLVSGAALSGNEDLCWKYCRDERSFSLFSPEASLQE
jgi:hypothetical protein